MVCAICYDAITPATGKIELSCSHSYHINCLATWFNRQNEHDATQHCPLCRHESNEHEIIPIVDNNEDLIYDMYATRYNDMMREHRATENNLRNEILMITLKLRIAEDIADKAKNWAEAAEESARKAYDTLDKYQMEKRARDVIEQKKQMKEDWKTWTTVTRDKKLKK